MSMPQSLRQQAADVASTAIKAILLTDPDLRPALLRLAFYDALLQRPSRGLIQGGSMRYFAENEKVPEQLRTAILKLEAIKEANAQVESSLSYADLYQLAGVVVIEVICGQVIKLRFGRQDSTAMIRLRELLDLEEVYKGGLKGDDVKIIRDIFNRVGISDEKEIVALFPAIFYATNPSMFTPESPTATQIKLSGIYRKLLDENKEEKAASTTDRTSSITNGKEREVGASRQNQAKVKDEDQSRASKIGFGHWKCLSSNDLFRQHVELFDKDEKQFLEEYMKAHKKLSEAGLPKDISNVEARHLEGISHVDSVQAHVQHSISDALKESHDIKHGIVFGVAMTILVGFVGFYFELMRQAAT